LSTLDSTGLGSLFTGMASLMTLGWPGDDVSLGCLGSVGDPRERTPYRGDISIGALTGPSIGSSKAVFGC